jgi:hypothetical protein
MKTKTGETPQQYYSIMPKIHRSRAAKAHFEGMGLPLMYLAPYSFKMAAGGPGLFKIRLLNLIIFCIGPPQRPT